MLDVIQHTECSGNRFVDCNGKHVGCDTSYGVVQQSLCGLQQKVLDVIQHTEFPAIVVWIAIIKQMLDVIQHAELSSNRFVNNMLDVIQHAEFSSNRCVRKMLGVIEHT